MDKNAVSLFRTNSTVKKKWLSMYNRTLHGCMHISIPIAHWISLQLEKTSTIETNKDWTSLQIYNPYIFMDLKRPLNWLKSKITKIEENLNEIIKHYPKMYTFLDVLRFRLSFPRSLLFYFLDSVHLQCKKCLTLEVYAIKRLSRGSCESGPKNDVHYREVSAIRRFHYVSKF